MPTSRVPSELTVLETCLYVDDLDAAEQFYTDVLGLARVSRRDGRHVFFRLGTGMLLLFLPESTSNDTADAPPHGARGPGHVAFHVPQETLTAWQDRLIRHGVAIEQIIEWPNAVKSIYFRDPAGNSLEFASEQLWFGD